VKPQQRSFNAKPKAPAPLGEEAGAFGLALNDGELVGQLPL